MSKYNILWTNQFKKDYKLSIKRKLPIDLLDDVIRKLANDEKLSLKHRDHALSGDWKDFRECHIQPDRLLIYQKDESALILTLTKTGSNSDLFHK